MKGQTGTKSISYNFIMNAILTMSSFLFPLITFPYASRVLGAEGIGKVSFAISFVAYFIMIAQLGIPTYGIKMCASVRDDREELTKLTHELLFISLITTVISYAAFAVCVAAVPKLHDQKLMLVVVSSTIMLNTVGMEWLFKGLEQYSYITARSIGFKFIAVAALFFTVKSENDYIWYAIVTIFASSASYVLNFIRSGRYIDYKIKTGYNVKRHIKPVMILFFLACTITIYTNLDTVMLGFMKSEIDVGYYNASVRVKGIVVSIITSLGAVLLPRASYYVEHNMMDEFKSVIRKALGFVLIVSIPMCFYFVIEARDGILLLCGRDFEGAVVPMQIIMPTIILIGITNVLGMEILVPLGKERYVFYSTMAGAVTDLILNAIFIPRMGASGAALGTLAAETVVLVVQVWFLRSEIIDHFREVSWYKLVLANVAAGIFGIGSLKVSAIFLNSEGAVWSFVKLCIVGCVLFGTYGVMLLITRETLTLEITDKLISMGDKIPVINKLLEKIKGITIKEALDSMFLLVFGFCLATSTLRTTAFGLPYLWGLDKVYTVVFGVLAVAKLLCEKNAKNIVIAIGMLGLYTCVYRSDGYMFLLVMAVGSICSMGIDYRKILKVFLVAVGSAVFISVFASFSGAITNYIYSSGNELRDSFGITYPTDFASYLFYLLIFTWVLWKRMPEWVMFVLSAGLTYIARYYAVSDTCTICGIVMCIIAAYMFIYKYMKKNKFGKLIEGWMKLVLIVAFPALGAITLFLIFKYGQGASFAVKLNNWLSRRLELPWQSYKENGIKIFGTPIEQIGNGSSTFMRQGYNFVDSSYALILIRYGWIMYGYCMIVWVKNTFSAAKNKDFRLAFCMAAIALHSVSEHHFFELNYNVLLVMPFACFTPEIIEQAEYKFSDVVSFFKNAYTQKKNMSIIMLGLSAIISLIASPYLLTYLRTFFQVTHLAGGGKKGFIVIAILVFMIMAVIAWSLCVADFIWKVLNKKSVIKPLIGVATITTMIAVASMDATKVLSSAIPAYKHRLSEDQEIMQLIADNKSGKVYSDKIPMLYKVTVPEMDYSFWGNEDIAREKCATMLMDRSYDSKCFLNRGFLFTEISDYSCIYTNDKSVIKALRDQGYTTHGFYSATNYVDKDYMARINGLSKDWTGNIVLEGKDESLLRGPYLNLRSGTYKVNYNLHIDKESESGKVCTLKVSAYSGDQVLAEKNVVYDDFDENGNYSAEVKFWSNDYPEIEILAIAEGDRTVHVGDISYRKFADYDTHREYNNRYLVSREEYYTLEGEPYTLPDGQAAVEYEYDKDKNIIDTRYYGPDSNPVIIKAGYAEIRKGYNERKYVAHEEYLDVNGEPVCLSAGYAYVDRVFDDEGNALEQRFYDENYKPVITTGGYHVLNREYDENRKVIREEFLGTDELPIKVSSGYSCEEREYDGNGNCIKQIYYDENGKRVLINSGYAEIRREYDDKNRVVAESYYNETGSMLMLASGYAKMVRGYDDRDYVNYLRYYDCEEKLVITKAGYAGLDRVINNKNQVLKDTYIGPDNEVMITGGGYAAQEFEYDENGNQIVNRYYDKDGNSVINTSGYAELHRSYNEKKQIIHEEYFGVNGERIMLQNGYAAVDHEYDEAGNQNYHKYYDIDLVPCIMRWGYAEIHRVFNDKKQVIQDTYYGVDGNIMKLGNGCSTQKYEYDDKGNQIIIKNYDEYDEPMLTTSGYFEIRKVFNDKKQNISESYYGINGEQVVNSWGVGRVDKVYDEKGKVIEQINYDLQGNII